MSKDIDFIVHMLSEGDVSSAKSKIVSVLNNTASRIAKKAEALGLKFDTYYIQDVSETVKATRVEIQFGNNKAFKLSQIVEVTIYDADDIVTEAPIAFDKRYNVPTYYSQKGPKAISGTLKLLTQFAKLVGEGR